MVVTAGNATVGTATLNPSPYAMNPRPTAVAVDHPSGSFTSLGLPDTLLPLEPSQTIASPLEAPPVDLTHTGVVAHEDARERAVRPERSLGDGAEV